MTPFAGVNRVTSPYGNRTYINSGKTVREFHRGHDLVPTKYAGESVAESAWTVREVTGGTVIKIAYDKYRGNYVDVRTSSTTFERYQHMKSIAVKKGQAVKQGDTVGVAGNTGNSTARHLHFGVFVNGSAEANAVQPDAWDGLANKAGTYAGNDTLDGGSSAGAALASYKIGPVSAGDAAKIKALAAQMAVACVEV